MLLRIAVGIGALALLAGAGLYLVGRGTLGETEHAGELTPVSRAVAEIARRVGEQSAAARALAVDSPRQILFGDLHVHTTFSTDAFIFSLPLVAGEGAHPPADACDFARFCSALDFWSINDHAEGLTPRRWTETVESIRRCNAVGQDPANPDTVAFLGWEWTQAGSLPENHYGHKNVVLAHTDDERIPARPIASRPIRGPGAVGRALLALRSGGARGHDLARYFRENTEVEHCGDADVRELPPDCHESAATPAVLYRKLDEWGHDAVVIPHGTTWGMYTPQGSTFDKQLAGALHDPERQTLIEVYSGHGDSEVHRPWRAVRFEADGRATCPEPTEDYLPTCWQAGEIIRGRCLAEGAATDECESRAVEARAFAAAAGAGPHRVVPGVDWAEWLDAGQCRDCALPAFNYRPGGSAQYILGIGNFDAPGKPRRFRLGFIASSDNHFARPGTGYKERHRIGMSESMGDGSPASGMFAGAEEEPVARARSLDPAGSRIATGNFAGADSERVASYLYTGGLVAVHAAARDRASVWSALGRREVYATSGPRMLLWFHLLNPPTGTRAAPMGSEVRMRGVPRFRVDAVGSFEQQPGCPDYAVAALEPERLEHLCKGECYHPSDRRRRIERIDVIRIRPQRTPGEDVRRLIEDPWRSFPCPPDPTGCTVEFQDPEFAESGRETLYYARVEEEPTGVINARGIWLEDGEVKRCPGPDGAADDCLGPHRPRAWSSPIWLDPAP